MPVPTLPEFKAHMQKSAASSDDDQELQRFLDTAVAQLEDRVGALEPVDVVDEVHLAPGAALVPRRWPVDDVGSVTLYPGGQAVPAREVAAGVDGYTQDGSVIRYPFGDATVLVSYTAARDPLPQDLWFAVVDLAAHLWRQTQNARVGTRPGVGGTQPEAVTPHLLPYRVQEAIDRNLKPDGVA